MTIDRPKRLKAQFSAERIAVVRFDNKLREPMVWAWETYGERVYTDLAALEKDIIDWCEKQDLNLARKQQDALLKLDNWLKQQVLMNTATKLMKAIGTDEYSNFNIFSREVEMELKALGLKLSASEKKQIMDAVSWYDASAEKVIKGITKLKGEKLADLLEHLSCTEAQLPDFGYFATDKPGEYLEYETESDLRDTENVPLSDTIHAYFLREVFPHVPEALINLDATKIGYEISFNKYFYRHKPLRTLDEVSADILQLEEESEGLIKEILSLV